MKHLLPLFLVSLLAVRPAFGAEPEVKGTRDLAYAEGDPLLKLDVYAPAQATGKLPVVVWIHGGGWQTGDKAEMGSKPALFAGQGLLCASVNYRLWPKVEMGVIIRDVAKAIGWVHTHASEYGGDPDRLLVMGHSAGAQLAALVCIDERYLKAEGVALTSVKGCVPVDGDTYDVPAIIVTAETRRKAHGQSEPKAGHREKFGTPEQQKDYSAVTHVAKGKGIPPFLILHVATHPDNSAQAFRLSTALREAEVKVGVFAAKDTDHVKLNNNLGAPGDAATEAVVKFVEGTLK